MATQTGSISFEAVGGFSSYASGEYAAKETAAALQTAIEQNANAITLSAQEIERGMTFVPTKHDREDAWFWYSLPSTQWTLLDDGWAHYEYTNSGASEVSTYIAPKSWGQVIPGEEYTFLIEIKNYSGFSGTGQFMYMQEMPGAQFWGTQVVKANGNVKSTRISYDDIVDGAFTKRFVKLADVDHIGDGTTYDNMCFRYRMYIKPNTTLSIDMRISVYPGDYAGPYNEYLTAASSAQLKVANDEIDLRVEKSGVIAAINASTEAEGGSAVKISADKVNIEGAAIFTSGRLSQSSLNAAYDAKGAASTVQENLDNLAIGGTNLLRNEDVYCYTSSQNQYLDKSEYSTSGKVLYNRTAVQNEGFYITNKARQEIGESYVVHFDIADTQKVISTIYIFTDGNKLGAIGANVSVYIDDVKIGAGNVALPCDLTGGATKHVDVHFEATAAPTSTYKGFILQANKGTANAFKAVVTNLKWEKGNKPTDWSPAPEDQTAYVDNSVNSIQVGGRNLLRNTATFSGWVRGNVNITGGQADPDGGNNAFLLTPTTGSDHYIRHGGNGHVPQLGEYTISVWLKASAAHTIYVTLEDRPAYRIQAALTTEWQKFTKVVDITSLGSVDYNFFVIGGYGSWPSTTPNVYVYHPKVEKGNRATDWTPAPEDIEANAVKRTQRIWYRTSSSTAPTSQYMPTAWVTETGDKWAANSTTVANWTAKATKLTNGSGTKYPYLFTCEQRQMGDGTLAYTTVLLDETTTVIDGGTIITHSVTANEIDATDLYVKSANIDGRLTAEQIDVENLKVPFSNFTDGDADFTDLKSTIDGINAGYQEADAALQVAIDELSGSLDGYESKSDAEIAHAALSADIEAASATATAAKNDVSNESAWRAKRFTDSTGKTDFHADGGTASLVMEADSAAFMADELEVARMDEDGLTFETGTMSGVLNLGANLAFVVLDDGDVVIKGIG